MKNLILVAIVMSLCAGTRAAPLSVESSTAEADRALVPVESLDLPRYMGTWFEVAKFPNWFQRNCVRDTRARYSILADGQVEVDNRCVNKDGRSEQATGMARQSDPGKPAELQVRFAPAWLSFVPLVWANYWVIDIDTRYQLVAVSEPARKYLWILSRTPQVDEVAYEALLARLKVQNFALDKLERTPQSD